MPWPCLAQADDSRGCSQQWLARRRAHSARCRCGRMTTRWLASSFVDTGVFLRIAPYQLASGAQMRNVMFGAGFSYGNCISHGENREIADNMVRIARPGASRRRRAAVRLSTDMNRVPPKIGVIIEQPTDGFNSSSQLTD